MLMVVTRGHRRSVNGQMAVEGTDSRRQSKEGLMVASVMDSSVALNFLVRKGKQTGSGSYCH